MYIYNKKFFVRVVLLMTLTMQAYGHHSVAVHYDVNKTIEISGVVKAWKFRSPHTFLLIEAKEADGSSRKYRVEGPSVPTMGRLGYDRDSFKPGDPIAVTAHPNRNPSKSLVFGMTINEKKIIETKKLEGVVAAKKGLSGVEKLEGRWQGEGFGKDTKNPFKLTGKTELPLTAVGYAAWKNYDQKNSPASKCEPANVPAIFESPSYLHDIRIKGDEVIFTHESYNVTRVVPLASEPRQAEPTGLFGLVKGRIEGDVLIVESTDYPPSLWGIAIASLPLGNGGDVPSSAKKKVVERYTSVDDGTKLRVDFTIDDPVYLTKKYTGFKLFKRVPDDTPLLSDECDIESASRFSR